MSLNYVNLVAKGRAHSPGRPWSEEELTALVKIAQTLNLQFADVAPAIRDGVRTVEEFKTHIAGNKVEIHDGEAVVVEVPKKKGRKAKTNE